MIEHLDSLQQDYQNYFYVSELSHGGVEKHSRVKSLEPIVNSGRLCIVDNGEAAEELMEQLELTDMESINSKNDDLIDSLAYQTRLIPRHFEKIEYQETQSTYY